MQMILHGYDDRSLTWTVDILDNKDNVLDVYNSVSIRIQDYPDKIDTDPNDIAHIQYNGNRRSIYGHTNDVDDLLMDDWEVAILFKELEVV